MTTALIDRLGRARRALWPLGTEPPPASVWGENRAEWRAYSAVRGLAVALLPVGGVPVLVLARDADPLGLPLALFGSVLVYLTIVTLMAGLLARAVRSAVAAAPREPASWRRSRERAVSLARIRTDVRAYVWLFGSVVVVGYLAGATYLWGAGGSAAGVAVVGALQPFEAAVFALAGVGAVGLVTSVYRELTVMRAEVAHRDGMPGTPG